MNCAVCGKDNQPGTRFCVHCGAALAAPRPSGGASAASPAATATIARPAPPAPSPPDTLARATAAPVTDAAEASSAPAYDANPAGGGKVLLAIGLAALVIAAGFVGYKIFGGSAEVKDSFAKFDTPAAPRETPREAPAPKSAEPPSAPRAEPPKADEKPPMPPPEAVKSEASKIDLPKVPAEAEKPRAPPPAKADAKTPGKSSSATTPGVPAPAAAPVMPPTARAPAAAPTPVTPAAAPAVQDRWAQMAAEQQECRKENLFNRVICDQKVRLRYCKDYWGTVPQCPGAVANPDKGQ